MKDATPSPSLSPRGEVTVRLRHARGGGATLQAEAVIDALRARVPVFSVDGRTIDDIVADTLSARGLTVAVAESCTGGLLGARQRLVLRRGAELTHDEARLLVAELPVGRGGGGGAGRRSVR